MRMKQRMPLIPMLRCFPWICGQLVNRDQAQESRRQILGAVKSDQTQIVRELNRDVTRLQQLEDIGAITGSSGIQIAREQEREWTNLIQMELASRPGNSAGQQSLNFSHKGTRVLQQLLHSNSPEKRVAACQS